jgi:hypothetical protein
MSLLGFYGIIIFLFRSSISKSYRHEKDIKTNKLFFLLLSQLQPTNRDDLKKLSKYGIEIENIMVHV